MLHKLSLPVQLLLIVLTVALFGNALDTTTISFFYSISLVFKECLGFLLPFIVFSFITTGIIAFKKNAPVVLAVLLSCIIISNATVAFFAYCMGRLCLPFLAVTIDPAMFIESKNIMPLFSISLPTIIRSDLAMLAAVVTGLMLSFFPMPLFAQAVHKLKNMVETIVNAIFIPLLPIYVFGFLLQINYQGVFIQLFQTYGKTFAFIMILQIIVLFLLYLIGAGLHLSKALHSIRVALPSYLTAFGTMSSTATIPVTIRCAQINTGNASLSAMATPILANIHLLGDAISTPILALVTLFIFTGSMPEPLVYATFVSYFCLNMLAVAGIPGGGIIVMIPILQTILGFNDMMLSVITTLYFLQDGLGTAGNVMGDGGLIIIINNILRRLHIRE